MDQGKRPSGAWVLSRMEDVCVHDERFLTPLNAAIRYVNKDVFDLLIEHKPALDYAPEMDKQEHQRLRNMASVMEQDSVQKTEELVARSFGVTPEEYYWLRTPLLEACRYGNREAMTALIARGAKLQGKDVLGASAMEICMDTGGTELLHAFMDACIEHGKAFPVDDYLLEQSLNEADVYDKMIRYGKPNAKAKRMMFNLACAQLDLDTVNAMLATGHDVNKSVFHDRTPLDEAASSHLCWTLGDKQGAALVQPLQRAYGSLGTKLVITGDDLQKLIDEFEAADDLAEAFMDEAGAVPEPEPGGNAPSQPPTILKRRLELIDRLLEQGFDLSAVDGSVLDDIVCMNEPRLLQKLLDLGVEFDLEEHDAEVLFAIQSGCFAIVEPLMQLGLPMPELESHWRKAYESYRQWCQAHGLTAYEPGTEGAAGGRPAVTFLEPYKAIIQSEQFWELGGESVLSAALLPDPPQPDEAVTVRLTHNNIYGPVDNVSFFVRRGESDNPRPFKQPDSVDGWQAMTLVEELVDLDGEVLPRDEADEEELAGEIRWQGTFESCLLLPPGEHLIEIRIDSPPGDAIPTGVLSDWIIRIGD